MKNQAGIFIDNLRSTHQISPREIPCPTATKSSASAGLSTKGSKRILCMNSPGTRNFYGSLRLTTKQLAAVDRFQPSQIKLLQKRSSLCTATFKVLLSSERAWPKCVQRQVKVTKVVPLLLDNDFHKRTLSYLPEHLPHGERAPLSPRRQASLSSRASNVKESYLEQLQVLRGRP